MDFGFYKIPESRFPNLGLIIKIEDETAKLIYTSLWTGSLVEDVEKAKKGKKTERQKEPPLPQLKRFKS